MKKPTLNLYCKDQNELSTFLERFYNKKIEKSIENITFDNPIEMIDLISAIIDNNDKYNISAWINLDEDIFIKISNSFDGKVKKDRHGHLISMKSDLTRYGLGLALIEKSVNKYNGLLNFDIDEENFTLTVLLYS